LCLAGYRESHSHVNSENTEAPSQITAGNAIASNSSLVSTSTSSWPPPKTFSDMPSSSKANRSVNMASAPKLHMEMKSPDKLANDIAVPLRVTTTQHMSTTRNNQSRSDVHNVPSFKTKQRDPMKTPTEPSWNGRQSQSKQSNGICTRVNTQGIRNPTTAVPSTVVEAKHLKQSKELNADPTTDISPSISIQPSGDISPRKFQPASRRLSAFFKLQE
jgi:hypothetical protein